MIHGKQKTTSWLQIYLQTGFVFVFHKSFLFTSMLPTPEKRTNVFDFQRRERGNIYYILGEI